VPFEEDDKDPSIWFLDHSYLENMFRMFKKVNGAQLLQLLLLLLLLPPQHMCRARGQGQREGVLAMLAGAVELRRAWWGHIIIIIIILPTAAVCPPGTPLPVRAPYSAPST
jgi:hypothetical protein